MPTYLYKCEDCEEEFDYWQSIHDPALKLHSDVEVQECVGRVMRVFTDLMFNKHQGQAEIIKTDNRGSKIKKHWDGKQDAHVVPESASMKLGMKNVEE